LNKLTVFNTLSTATDDIILHKSLSLVGSIIIKSYMASLAPFLEFCLFLNEKILDLEVKKTGLVG
jgi:hypothetical protein